MQPRKQRVVASDSDEEPAPLSKKRAPAEKGKKRVVQSDDDESDAPTEYSDEDEQAAAVAAKKRQMDGAAAHKSKGKGKGRAVAASSDEELDEAEEGQGNAKAKGALSADEKRALVQSTVRQILFTESSRKSITRAEIVKLGMKGQGKYYVQIMEEAQKVLRSVMGMELVPLRHKEGVTAKNPTKLFVVRSTLPQSLVQESNDLVIKALKRHAPLPADANDMQRAIAGWEDDLGHARNLKREEGGAYALLGIILTVILVNSKILGDDQLMAYLRRLSLTPTTIVPSSLAGSPHPLTLNAYLTLLIKQNYLERTTSTNGKSTQSKPKALTKRGQASGDGEVGDASIEWRWGARAEVEFGEMGIARFAQEVYDVGTVAEMAASAPGRSKQQVEKEDEARRVKMLDEIARAAGGALTEAKQVKAIAF